MSPLPAACAAGNRLSRRDSDRQRSGRRIPSQLSVLDRWPDRIHDGCSWIFRRRRVYQLQVVRNRYVSVVASVRETERQQAGWLWRPGSPRFTSAQAATVSAATDRQADSTSDSVTEWTALAGQPRIVSIDEELVGAMRTTVRLRGTIDLGRSRLELEVRIHFFAGCGTVRLDLTVRNGRRALHGDGFWELGDSNSVVFRDLSVRVEIPGAPDRVVCWPEPGVRPAVLEGEAVLYQDSSGGENWR